MSYNRNSDEVFGKHLSVYGASTTSPSKIEKDEPPIKLLEAASLSSQELVNVLRASLPEDQANKVVVIDFKKQNRSDVWPIQ